MKNIDLPKEALVTLERISAELTALSTTFQALDIACNDSGMALPEQSLYIPTRELVKLSVRLRRMIELKETE